MDSAHLANSSPLASRMLCGLGSAQRVVIAVLASDHATGENSVGERPSGPADMRAIRDGTQSAARREERSTVPASTRHAGHYMCPAARSSVCLCDRR